MFSKALAFSIAGLSLLGSGLAQGYDSAPVFECKNYCCDFLVEPALTQKIGLAGVGCTPVSDKTGEFCEKTQQIDACCGEIHPLGQKSGNGLNCKKHFNPTEGQPPRKI
ncbi:hypothetical protein K4F52_007366 [Lecanicillium sp. MT-2017a]|nr:hypothetical protein K4F52_007366 [Lecanicillium sp. MT-2017a]